MPVNIFPVFTTDRVELHFYRKNTQEPVAVMDRQGYLEVTALSIAFCAVVSLDVWGLIRFVLVRLPAGKNNIN